MKSYIASSCFTWIFMLYLLFLCYYLLYLAVVAASNEGSVMMQSHVPLFPGTSIF